MENDTSTAHTVDDNDDTFGAPILRKRTKTGCLTCRKRRIKCGEERPICRNCVKSKRHCDGYNQRVIYRPHVDFRHFQGGATTIDFPVATTDMAFVNTLTAPAYATRQNLILPRPLLHVDSDQLRPHQVLNTAPADQIHWNSSHALHDLPTHAQPLQNRSADISQSLQARAPNILPLNRSRRQSVPIRADTAQHYTTALSGEPVPSTVEHGAQNFQQQQRQRQQQSLGIASITSGIGRNPDWSISQPPISPLMPHTAPLVHNPWSSLERQGASSDTGHVVVAPSQPADWHIDDPADLLYRAAIEYQDDNYHDVTIMDEPDAFLMNKITSLPELERSLSHALRVGQLQPDKYMRSPFGISEGILDFYRPEITANPLNNPATARVFTHFVHVTSTTISSFARASRTATMSSDRANIPFSQRGLWTHAVPMMALQDQGLLQAILALSSLHIAKLTGASTTPSYKHYAYALKRVHHTVSQRIKRHRVEVQAASLLLAIYELWCAEHVKWSRHLTGTGQLLMETDFAAMQRRVTRLRLEKHYEQSLGYPTFNRAKEEGNIPFHLMAKMDQYRQLDQIPHIDARVVSKIAGRHISYEDYGHVHEEPVTSTENHDNVDLPTYEIQKDLFWAYCKQDMIGSVVSGNPLLMPFSRWTDCPPRQPAGQEGDVHGTHDHLILLLGRVADFVVRDRKRKLRFMAMNDGQWRPPSATQRTSTRASSSTTPSQHSPARSSHTAAPQMPSFFGMAPIPPSRGMPSSYYAAGQPPTSSPDQEDILDLATATERAIEEWSDIVQALELLVSLLDESFQPLDSRQYTPPATPFGPGTVYQSLDIGNLWAYLNLAWIFVHRSHPHMPPHAHAAAAVAAGQTIHYAAEIVRIAAGVMPPNTGQPLAPATGAAMCDLCLPLFLAGNQLTSPQQRDWVISTLFEIERRCAYETAGVIAHGCQTSWYKAGQAGRGPPYERRFNERHQDIRLNGGWIRLDPTQEPDQEDVTDRRFVHTKAAARLHWAVGILGTEEDQ